MGIQLERVDCVVRDYYEKGERIELETDRLFVRAIQTEDTPNYQRVWSDKETMLKYSDNEGQIKALGEEKWAENQQAAIAKRIDLLVKRWKEKDPFSAFAVFKKDTDEFVGHVVVGHGDNPGEASLAYVIYKPYWNQGFGTEAVEAVVKKIFPALKKIHEEIYQKPLEVEGAPFTELTATARLDNPYSIKILQKMGMQYVEEKEEYGAPRAFYKLQV
jgi:RimJ/RimL family protein N-acetyltransferase